MQRPLIPGQASQKPRSRLRGFDPRGSRQMDAPWHTPVFCHFPGYILQRLPFPLYRQNLEIVPESIPEYVPLQHSGIPETAHRDGETYDHLYSKEGE